MILMLILQANAKEKKKAKDNKASSELLLDVCQRFQSVPN